MPDKPLDRFLQANTQPPPRTPEQQAGDAIIELIGGLFQSTASLMAGVEVYTAQHGWNAILAAASESDRATLAAVPAIRAIWPSMSSGALPAMYDEPAPTPDPETPAQ